MYFVQEIHFKYKDTNGLKVKDWKKKHGGNYKKAVLDSLTSKKRPEDKDKEGNS